MINEQGLRESHEHSHFCYRKCVSWTAVIVGALVGIGISYLINIFGVAISLSIFSMTNQGVATFAIGGLIGVAIGIAVAMYIAGWVAGYLGRPYCSKRNLGILYGFITWTLILILTTLLTQKLVEHTIAYSNFLSRPADVSVTHTPTSTVIKAKVINRKEAATVSQSDLATGFSVGAFIVFILFYIGAFACCVGGYYGMSYRDETY